MVEDKIVLSVPVVNFLCVSLLYHCVFPYMSYHSVIFLQTFLYSPSDRLLVDIITIHFCSSGWQQASTIVPYYHIARHILGIQQMQVQAYLLYIATYLFLGSNNNSIKIRPFVHQSLELEWVSLIDVEDSPINLSILTTEWSAHYKGTVKTLLSYKNDVDFYEISGHEPYNIQFSLQVIFYYFKADRIFKQNHETIIIAKYADELVITQSYIIEFFL